MAFRYTTRAFAPLMAKAAKLSIVEVGILPLPDVSGGRFVAENAPQADFQSLSRLDGTFFQAENIVEIGELGPMEIDLPGIYIDRIVPATVDKQIEITTLRKPQSAQGQGQDQGEAKGKNEARIKREKIARRAAKELKDGFYCNLGVGMPVLAASFLEPGVKVWLQSENGILGMGEYPTEDEVDA